MSHTLGEIWAPDGTLRGFFDYDGCVDIAHSRIYATEQSVKYRSEECHTCTCGGDGELVTLYTSYGSGFHWPGRACFTCMAIPDDYVYPFGSSDEFDTTDGHPFFEQWMKWRFGQVVPCPKCGAMKLKACGDRYPIACDGCGVGLYEWEVAPK